MQACTPRGEASRSLYTAEERQRRDASPWTLVQGVLAPIQFLVFLVSLALVLRYLADRRGPRSRDASRSSSRRWCSTPSWSPAASGRRRSSAATCSRPPSSGKTCSACWCWRCTRPIWSRSRTDAARRARPDVAGAGGLRHLRHQRHAVPAEAARGAARQRAAARRRRCGRGQRQHEPGDSDPRRAPKAAPTRRCCASAASARCSAA